MDFTGAKLPCFSIGTSIRNSQAFNKNPGPGAHEALENSLMGRKKSPRATIGNSTREEFNKKQMLMQGLREPENEEEMAQVQQMSQQTNAQDELMQSMAKKEEAEAQ